MNRLILFLSVLVATGLMSCSKDDNGGGSPLSTAELDSTITIVPVRAPGWAIMDFNRHESAQGALVDVELVLASLERASGYSPVYILNREDVVKVQWQWDIDGNVLTISCNIDRQLEENAEFDWEFYDWLMPCENETVCYTSTDLASHTITLPDGLSQYRLHFRVWLADGEVLEGVYDFYHELVYHR